MDRVLGVISAVNDYFKKVKLKGGDSSLNELLHTYGVGYLSASIASARGLNQEIAFIAGVLHDVGKIAGASNKNHNLKGVQIARNLLIGLNSFTSDEIKIICSAIYNHSNKKSIGFDYDEVIKDADIIEKLFTEKEKYEDKKNKRKRLKNALRELEIKLRKRED